MTDVKTKIFDQIDLAISQLSTANISEERKEILQPLADYIQHKANTQQAVRINFICTHNSRRSHLGHLWAQLAASYYQVHEVYCYSGGTETTVFNPSAVNALKEAGMHILRTDDSSNPVYRVRIPGQKKGIDAFSKKYTDPPNPTEGFIAVMTCVDADEACPIVHGARSRHAIPYEDPKKFDDTDEESDRYAKRCVQIAREMLYLFASV